MRYTLYRGLAQVSNWVRLKFAAMNLKKLANWKSRRFPALFRTLRSLIVPSIYFTACLVQSRQAVFRQTERAASPGSGPLPLNHVILCQNILAGRMLTFSRLGSNPHIARFAGLDSGRPQYRGHFHIQIPRSEATALQCAVPIPGWIDWRPLRRKSPM